MESLWTHHERLDETMRALHEPYEAQRAKMAVGRCANGKISFSVDPLPLSTVATVVPNVLTKKLVRFVLHGRRTSVCQAASNPLLEPLSRKPSIDCKEYRSLRAFAGTRQ